MLWFTSDPHFNHRRIIELSRRPFPDIATMNAALIENWNARVQATDEVYVMGDFAFHYADSTPLDDIFHALNGEKHLIIGNHDEQNRKVIRLPWVSQAPLAHIRYGEARFVLCHFPLERWWHQERGVIHLHGHCHGGLRRFEPHRFDVGVDVGGLYAPWSAVELIERAAAQAFEPTDYHV